MISNSKIFVIFTIICCSRKYNWKCLVFWKIELNAFVIYPILVTRFLPLTIVHRAATRSPYLIGPFKRKERKLNWRKRYQQKNYLCFWQDKTFVGSAGLFCLTKSIDRLHFHPTLLGILTQLFQDCVCGFDKQTDKSFFSRWFRKLIPCIPSSWVE